MFLTVLTFAAGVVCGAVLVKEDKQASDAYDILRAKLVTYMRATREDETQKSEGGDVETSPPDA
jgi:hypothetical protein